MEQSDFPPARRAGLLARIADRIFQPDVVTGPKPPPAPPPSVPMEVIQARFNPSESQLIDKLTTLAAGLKRRGEWIGEVIEWDSHVPDDVAAETRGLISSAANTAGELLRCRENAKRSRERAACPAR